MPRSIPFIALLVASLAIPTAQVALLGSIAGGELPAHIGPLAEPHGAHIGPLAEPHGAHIGPLAEPHGAH